MEIIGSIISFIVDMVGSLGYFGIFFMMLLESSFLPFPSEVAMIPAGYLSYKGEMNIVLAVISGLLGSIAGGLINYYLAYKFGRNFLIRFGKFVFFTQSTMIKMENYFDKHGAISTFIGRLVPVVRQYISLPAGLAKMNLKLFCFYTGLGAGIWMIVLVLIGYSIGAYFGSDFEISHIIHAFTSHDLSDQEAIIKAKVKTAAFYTLIFVVITTILYIMYYNFFKKRRQ